jgi:ABC-2 type transport system permease protein
LASRNDPPHRQWCVVPVFRHELRRLLSARAYWGMLLLLTPLTGYGYVEAVRLFGEASRTALQFPELARGMAPLDGVLVPTLGAFYLGTTLLFPFVAIRAVGEDKESGALKLALQWPLSPLSLIAVKLLAVAAAWSLSLVIPFSALCFWQVSGGHLALAETANLFLGHALCAFAVAGIAFFAASLAGSAATAAIVTLAFTLGFWVLDFAASTGPQWLKAVGDVSPTQALKQFERGLFSLPHVLGLALLGFGLAAMAVLALPPGHTRRRKTLACTAAALTLAALLAAAPYAHVTRDLSDDRRNSFNPGDEAALARMDKGLTITLLLAPEDSRARELATNVLAKLKRLVPHLTVCWAAFERSGPFAAMQDARYGLVVYEYAGRKAESRSNSPREILPLLHDLAGAQVAPVELRSYPGHPLVANPWLAEVWFYFALPAVLLLAAARSSRVGRVPAHLSCAPGVEP